MKDFLPLGCVVAVVEVLACVPTSEALESIGSKEQNFGNYAPDRYGWILDSVLKLPKPVPVRGMQGLFNLPASVEFEVRRQMEFVP